MEPLRLESSRTDEGVRIDVIDPEALFMDGAGAFEEKNHVEAARKFGILIQRFPESRLAKPALYNRGMALLAIPRPGESADVFQEYVRRFPGEPDTVDAWHKLGQAWSEAGEWKMAYDTLSERLEMEPLTLMQEVEIRATSARCARMLGRHEEARDQSSAVKALHDKHKNLPEMKGNYHVAMASFEGAETYRDRFVRIKFVLPVEKMEKDLIEKANLFLKAQSGYLQTIRLRNTYWGVKAGVRVGRLYEEFYNDIMSAEVPPELAPDEVEIYLAELRKRTRPMVQKAVVAYESNMALARMYGARDDWFGDTKDRLEKLKKILEEIPE